MGKTSLLVQFDQGKFIPGSFSATVGIGFTVRAQSLSLGCALTPGEQLYLGNQNLRICGKHKKLDTLFWCCWMRNLVWPCASWCALDCWEG